jgi:uncharacterized protein (DUF302 family)
MSAVSETEKALGFGVVLDVPLDEAIELTKAALKEEGFGVLTSIDVKATLKEKIDEEFEPYVILGACNPRLAFRGLSAAPDLGLLLPCNVTVHEIAGGTRVTFIDPHMMLGVAPPAPELESVAIEAAIKLRRVAAALDPAGKH